MQHPRIMSTNHRSLLCSIRRLLQLILAALLVRIGLDYTPFGKTDAATLIGLAALYLGIGMIVWVGLAAIASAFRRIFPSPEVSAERNAALKAEETGASS